MLQQVLTAIETAHEPISLAELSRKLNIEAGALEGMIQFWIRKGQIQSDATVQDGCGPSCCKTSDCSFVTKMPKTYSLATQTNKK